MMVCLNLEGRYNFLQQPFIIILLLMLAENQDQTQNILCKTDGSFSKQRFSLNTTRINSTCEKTSNRLELVKHDSQPTLPELPPYCSRALDFEQTYNITPMENQIDELILRFSGIHKMLIKHSEYQSALHEKKRGFKALSIDQALLTTDYSNKAIIIGDISALVEGYQMESEVSNFQQILDTKFLQYYLQRHYGGLGCQLNSMSLQQKLDEQEQSKQNDDFAISNIQRCESVIAQASLPEKKEKPTFEVKVETVKIVQVQIPVIVYKFKYEEQFRKVQNISNNNIQTAINRFQQDHSQSQRDREESISVTPISSNIGIVGSIMIDSIHNSLKPKQTEIELIYSDIPSENNFKLPLDSFAQLESLISYSSNGSHSRPTTERENIIPLNEEDILVTQNGISRSVLQKIQQNQRLLNEENLQLKENIACLQQKLVELQKRNRQVEGHNKKIVDRLEEQIQQSEYFASKLDEINAEVLEEKVQCLTYLNLTKQRRIEALVAQVAEKDRRQAELSEKYIQIEKALQQGSQQLARKDEEIQILSRQLLQKQQQLHQLQTCEDDVIQIASNFEDSLRKQISKLELQKSQLQEELKQYKQRLKTEGISLQYEQAQQIKGIIEQRQHVHRLQLADVNKRYEEVMGLYQQQLKQLKNQLKKIQQINEKKSDLLACKQAKQLASKAKNKQHMTQFEEIIKEYDRQLQQKDEQILALRLRNDEGNLKLVLDKFTQTINLLEGRLVRERQQKNKLTSKFIELEEVIKNQLAKKKCIDEESQQLLMEQLTDQLEKKIKQNKVLKVKTQEYQSLIANLLNRQGQREAVAAIKKENDKLRDINRKLKKYTILLEDEIRAVCIMNQSEDNKDWINSLMEQKNYFCDLLTQEASVKAV